MLRDAVRAGRGVGAAAGGCASTLGTDGGDRRDGQSYAEDRTHPVLDRGLGEAHGAGDGIPVGERQRAQAAFGRPLNQIERVRGAVWRAVVVTNTEAGRTGCPG